MLLVLTQVWPWVLAALALGTLTGWMARIAAARFVQPAQLPDLREYALKSELPPNPPLEQMEALASELAARDAAITELRTGLDREVAMRRAAIARLEGLMIELAETRSGKSSPGTSN